MLLVTSSLVKLPRQNPVVTRIQKRFQYNEHSDRQLKDHQISDVVTIRDQRRSQQDEDAGPDEFKATRNSEDVAEQKEVADNIDRKPARSPARFYERWCG